VFQMLEYHVTAGEKAIPVLTPSQAEIVIIFPQQACPGGNKSLAFARGRRILETVRIAHRVVWSAMILGIGTDIVSIERIAELRRRHADRFVRRILSEAEVSIMPGAGADAFLAGRFAAKEAVAQAEALYDQAVASSGPTIGVDEKEIEAARAALRSAQASVGIYQAQRGKRTIVSPVSGIISKRYVDEGEIAPMGGSPLLTIVTADSLQFAATVSELDVDRVMVGSEVTVTVDGLPNAEITGRVAQVLPAGEVSSRNFTIKIAIPAGQGVKPGMFARGEVVVGAAQDAVIIPKDTLIEEAGQMMAYIVEGNAAKRQTVTLGIEGVAVVEVLEGVNPGDKVVIRGQKGLTDGASVTIDNTVEYDLPTNGLNDAEPEPEKATGDS